MRPLTYSSTFPWRFTNHASRWWIVAVPLVIYTLAWLTPNLYLFSLKPGFANGSKLVLALLLMLVWHLSFKSTRTAVACALPFFLLWPFDLHYSLHYQQPPTTVVITTLLQTTTGETLDYLRGREVEVAGLVVLALLAWSFALKVTGPLATPAPRWLRWVCRSFFITFVGLGLLMYAPVLLARMTGEPVMPTKSVLLDIKGVFPFGRVVSVAEFARERMGIDLLLKHKQAFRFGAAQPAALAGVPQRYVLVIGETGRPDRWSLNGYLRETNPRLKQIEGVQFLHDVVSTVTVTAYAVPAIISRMPGGAQSQLFDEPSILSAFKEAGFKTYWLSMQPSFGKTESMITRFAYEADEVHFLSASNNAEIGVTPPDTVAVDRLAQLLSRPEEKQFFVIHTMGSHDAYHKRYPAEFDVFKPSLTSLRHPDHHDPRLKAEVNNAYDNSVLFTDTVLASVIDLLRQKGDLSGIYYSADHGENLFDGVCTDSGHGGSNLHEYPVPALVWTSPDHRSRWPEKARALAANQARPATIENTFATTLDLAGIQLQGRVPPGSVLDPAYVPSVRRVAAGGKLLNWDAGVFEGECRALVSDDRPGSVAQSP